MSPNSLRRLASDPLVYGIELGGMMPSANPPSVATTAASAWLCQKQPVIELPAIAFTWTVSELSPSRNVSLTPLVASPHMPATDVNVVVKVWQALGVPTI